MIRAVLTVNQVMDLWDIHATVLEQDAMTGAWQPIAATSDSLLADPDLAHDTFHSLLAAIRLWSEMTISR